MDARYRRQQYTVRHVRAFCRFRQPWGLGIEPAKLKAYLAAEKGQKFVDLEVVPRGDSKGGAPIGNDNASASRVKESTAPIVGEVVSEMSHGKRENL